MTTTHTFQGLNPESRPSSRVLNPPGGSSSNIFGGLDNWTQHQQAQNNSESTNRIKTCDVGQDHQTGLNPITSEPYEQMKAKHENLVKPGLDQQPSTTMSCESISSKAVTESSVHLGPNLNSSTETITQTEKLKSTSSTSEGYQQSSYIFGANEPKEVRSTRVTQPPGGRSTKLW